MPKNRANEPCPFGSGKKLKRCCMGRETGIEAVPPEERSVERDGQRIIANDDLDDAAAYLKRKKRDLGSVHGMADFVKSLKELLGDMAKSEESLSALAAFFWYLALIDGSKQRKVYDEFVGTLRGTKPPEELWLLALEMVERHRKMFPDMHE